MGEDVRERVKERYAGAALTVLEGTGTASCCGSAGERGLDSEALGVDWTGGGYSVEELGALPKRRARLRWGVATPRPLPHSPQGRWSGPWQRRRHRRLALGQESLPGGKAYGLDMTDEMLALAEKNRPSRGGERRVPKGTHRGDTAA